MYFHVGSPLYFCGINFCEFHESNRAGNAVEQTLPDFCWCWCFGCFVAILVVCINRATEGWPMFGFSFSYFKCFQMSLFEPFECWPMLRRGCSEVFITEFPAKSSNSTIFRLLIYFSVITIFPCLFPIFLQAFTRFRFEERFFWNNSIRKGPLVDLWSGLWSVGTLLKQRKFFYTVVAKRDGYLCDKVVLKIIWCFFCSVFTFFFCEFKNCLLYFLRIWFALKLCKISEHVAEELITPKVKIPNPFP